VTDTIERALAEIKFDRDGLVPAIAQQHDTGEILPDCQSAHGSSEILGNLAGDARVEGGQDVVGKRQGAAAIGAVGIDRDDEDHGDHQDDAKDWYADAQHRSAAIRARGDRIDGYVDYRIAAQPHPPSGAGSTSDYTPGG